MKVHWSPVDLRPQVVKRPPQGHRSEGSQSSFYHTCIMLFLCIWTGLPQAELQNWWRLACLTQLPILGSLSLRSSPSWSSHDPCLPWHAFADLWGNTVHLPQILSSARPHLTCRFLRVLPLTLLFPDCTPHSWRGAFIPIASATTYILISPKCDIPSSDFSPMCCRRLDNLQVL